MYAVKDKTYRSGSSSPSIIAQTFSIVASVSLPCRDSHTRPREDKRNHMVSINIMATIIAWILTMYVRLRNPGPGPSR